MDDILSGMQISDYYRASYMNSVQDVQFERDVSRDFTTSASLVTSASLYDPYENEPKLGTYDTVMAYPFRVAENTGENDYTTITQLIGNPGNTLNVGYEGVPIDWSTRWDNKVVNPPDLTGLITESMGLQSFQLTGNTTSDGWMPSENASLSSNHPSGSSSSFSNELSLTLATSQPSFFCRAGIQDQFSDRNCSRISEHSLNNQHQIHQQTPCNLGDASSCLISNRPAQLSQCYSGSRYLNVMQEILADFANFSLNQMSSPGIGTVSDANGYEHPSDTHPRGCSSMKHTSRDWDLEHKRKQLLGLLQVVDDQYNRLVDEIHTIISAFHAVAELDPQIHARFALQTVSFLYKNLRERISNLVLAIGAACVSSKGSPRDDKSFEISFIQKQWALQQLKRKDQHLWRPQRGLPERSVSVLRAWMFQNFLHPYPKDAEKDFLALKSGLTRGQVSNWFINARVRLWKPLIEEMYAEMSSRHDGGSRNLWTVHHGRYSIN